MQGGVGNTVSYASSNGTGGAQADFILLMTGWDEYKRLSPEHFRQPQSAAPLILDVAPAFGRNVQDVADVLVLGKND